MAPTIAVSKVLDRAGLTLQDFDFYEIHEAFAAQVLCTLKAWNEPSYCREHLGKNAPLGEIDRAKMNVKGSSMAVGHPFAATGARITANWPSFCREGRGPRPDFDLHGRWHGRCCDHGGARSSPASRQNKACDGHEAGNKVEGRMDADSGRRAKAARPSRTISVNSRPFAA